MENPGDGASCLARVLGRGGENSPFSDIDVTLCDVFRDCGRVDPLPFLTAEQRVVLSSPTTLCPTLHPGLRHYPGVEARSRHEYARYVALELRRGKVDLAFAVLGGGSVFCRRKPNGRLRVIWNGAAVSEATVQPPKPPLLASPASLVWLESTRDKPLRLVKRDGECMFDQLRLPAVLRPLMGQPPLPAWELCEALGCGLPDLQKLAKLSKEPQRADLLYPRLLVWGMGFSWSSLACQSLSVQVCHHAGLLDEDFLADEMPPPLSAAQAVAVATDDICILTNGDRQHAARWGSKIDRALASHGITKNGTKDVNGDLSGTLIGVDLLAGRYLSPGLHKLAAWHLAGVELLTQPAEGAITPLELSAFLGTPHWFMQLMRPLYSCLETVYEHTSAQPDTLPRLLTERARAEIALALVLAPLAEVDTAAPWCSDVLATDASKVFGFGVTVATTTPTVARDIGRLAKHHSFFATLIDHPGDQEPKERTGQEHKLPLNQSDFHTVISSRARFVAHSGALEANAVVLGLRWLSRRAANVGRRVAMLCDAQAVLHALKKGRSSAPTIRALTRRVAALCLGMNWVVHYVYIPTEWNPADEPSRRPHRPVRRGQGARL